MEDLYTRFNREFDEKIGEVRKLLTYLSDSFFGTEDDLKRIRTLYRDILDFKSYFVSKNNSITSFKERAYRKDFQGKDSMDGFISEQVDPFIDMFKFIIELYEENR